MNNSPKNSKISKNYGENEILFGIHIVLEFLKNDPKRLIKVFLSRERNDSRFMDIKNKIRRLNISFQLVSMCWINKQFSRKVNHQGVLVVVKKKNEYKESDLLNTFLIKKDPLFLILDGITDSQNLGACFRCSDAAGVDAIIVPKNRSVRLNSTVKKVASGSAENVPIIYVVNLFRTLCFLKKNHVFVVGTSKKSNCNLYYVRFSGPLALVLGSENNGIRKLVRSCCDKLIYIPMFGKIESLNVSVSAAICLFEIIRQRNYLINI